ncbi:MAG: hypothetical protein ACRD7E_01775 [Bryobacteraceae bacterium]
MDALAFVLCAVRRYQVRLIVRTVRWVVPGLITASLLIGQQPVAVKQNQETNLKAYVELLRKDLKKDKVAIMTEMMELTPEDSAKFWTIYTEYDKELTGLGDQRIAFIRIYAENFGSLTDQKVTEIIEGLADVESGRTALLKRYFQKMSQTLNPKLAARFVQVEHQILLIVDLQIAASLPVVE